MRIIFSVSKQFPQRVNHNSSHGKGHRVPYSYTQVFCCWFPLTLEHDNFPSLTSSISYNVLLLLIKLYTKCFFMLALSHVIFVRWNNGIIQVDFLIYVTHKHILSKMVSFSCKYNAVYPFWYVLNFFPEMGTITGCCI